MSFMRQNKNNTFAEDILEACGGEEIEHIVIHQGFTCIDDDDFKNRQIAKEFLDTPITWDIAKPLLDYAYDTGYGGVDCHGIVAWTPNKIIFISCYDGSTCVEWKPRNPTLTTLIGEGPYKRSIAEPVGGG